MNRVLGVKFQDNIYNVPEHDTVKDRIVWRLEDEMCERFGIGSINHEQAVNVVDAFIESKREKFPNIDEQMAKGPCTKYEDRGVGKFMHMVVPFARKCLDEDAQKLSGAKHIDMSEFKL